MAEAHLISVDSGEAPRGYELSPGESLVVESATAEFDGTAAAGDFLPAVGIYAQNGALIARAVCSTPVAAGDSAEVTFAPF